MYTLLAIAASHGQAEALSLMIAAGAYVDGQDSQVGGSA
jgi:ankyrin repeat protein